MRHTINTIAARLSAVFSITFGVARQKADHRKMVRHVIAMNLYETIPEIISEAASCLKEMLDYRLFAFVVKKESGLDIWLDPRMYRASLEPVIMQDFHISETSSLNYLNHKFHDDDIHWAENLDDLIYYEHAEENFTSRIYMLPQKDTSPLSGRDDIIQMLLKSCSAALIRQTRIENLANAAVIDPLTGCYNRREFAVQLKRTIASAVRYQNSLSIFMLDLDHFKAINDTYGHQAGDEVLKKVSGLVRENMRSGDILARYGGEEFIAILPETDKIKAMELADRLRMKIASNPVVYEGRSIRVTASFGVAQFDRRADMERMIHDADSMLYRAKSNGRNTVMPGLMKIVPGKVRGVVQAQPG